MRAHPLSLDVGYGYLNAGHLDNDMSITFAYQAYIQLMRKCTCPEKEHWGSYSLHACGLSSSNAIMLDIEQC